jgi:thioredoxin 1
MRRVLALAVIAALTLTGCARATGPAAARAHPPVVVLGDYRPEATTSRAITLAFDAAHRSGRNVLIVFGDAGCPHCQELTELSRDPAVNALLTKGFEVATVDVGQSDRNLETVRDFGVDLDRSGIPALAVLSPSGRGKVVTNDGEFSGARRVTTADVSAFLTRWAPAGA